MKSNLSSSTTPEPRARRSDVFSNRVDPLSQRGQRGAYLRERVRNAPGVDSAGRFIGRGDVDRGYLFFLRSRNLPEPTHGGGGFGGEFGRGTSGRPSRTTLTAERLLAIHERARRGEKLSHIARSYGLDRAIIAYALRPSPAMRRALATAAKMAA